MEHPAGTSPERGFSCPEDIPMAKKPAPKKPAKPAAKPAKKPAKGK